MDEETEEPKNSIDKAAKWKKELASVSSRFKTFHGKGEKVIKAFKGEEEDPTYSQLNLFHANTITLKSMLFGKLPKVDVDRTYSDPDDDLARVASLMLNRILNSDIEEDGDNLSAVLKYCLENRLLPGLAVARVKYDFEEGVEQVPAQTDPTTGKELAPFYERKFKKSEWVDTVYVHWKDVRWSAARTWNEVRWVSFRTYLSRKELISRFGEAGQSIPLNSKSPLDAENKSEIWSKAEVWEIWDKESSKVYWMCEDSPELLGESDPPTKHSQFFPMPQPWMANCTTEEVMPLPDYCLAQDLYREIDILQERISLLTEACKLVGVYDKKSEGLKSVLKEGVENELVPVDNWAAFAERGGLKGVIDWLPLEQVVKAIDILTSKQNEKIQQLYQVTGMSDILRGAGDPRASATQDSLKSKFASVRIQAIQDEFAAFVTDLQKCKYEIMAQVFDPKTFLDASNVMMTSDAPLAAQALELLKNPDISKWRITIAPETLAMVDFSALRQERTEYITALGTYLQSAAPIVEKFPQAAPALIKLLQWGLAGFKGSREIEGVLDKAVAELIKSQQQGGGQKPDPEMQKMQAEVKLKQEEHQQKMQQKDQEFQLKMKEMQQEYQTTIAKTMAEVGALLQKYQLELEAAREKNQIQREGLQNKAEYDIHQLAIKQATPDKSEGSNAR